MNVAYKPLPLTIEYQCFVNILFPQSNKAVFRVLNLSTNMIAQQITALVKPRYRLVWNSNAIKHSNSCQMHWEPLAVWLVCQFSPWKLEWSGVPGTTAWTINGTHKVPRRREKTRSNTQGLLHVLMGKETNVKETEAGIAACKEMKYFDRCASNAQIARR